MKTETGFFGGRNILSKKLHKIEITQIIHTEWFKAAVSPVKAAGLHWQIQGSSLWKWTDFLLKYFDNWEESCQW